MSDRPSGDAAPSSRLNDSAARVLVVVGTRPEAIKMAPVLRALDSRRPALDSRLALTGQHTQLVDSALETFHLAPDWDLEIMREGQSPSEVGRRCLREMDAVIEEWGPDLVLVQGDTATVFFSALSAYLRGVPIGHVEAGLRTGDLRDPFPEEGFRRLTGALADLHFAPTERARGNLLREGVSPDRIHVTGNTVVDALLDVASRGDPPESPVLSRLLEDGAPPFLLLTAHRRESFGEPLERVFRAIARLVEEESDVEVVYPVHPNPSVTEPARRILGGRERIHLIEPVSYPDLVAALQGAAGVLTDSGGIQEEAPTFGTPVIVLREKSDRTENPARGGVRVVGTDPDRIVEEARRMLRERNERGRRFENPYGHGTAGERIAEVVESFLLAPRSGGAG